MKILYTTIFICFIFCMQFISAFAISGTINLPVIFGVFLLGFGVLNVLNYRKISLKIFCIEHLIILFFLCFVLLTLIVNGRNSSSAINHTLAYFSSFLLFFSGPLLFFFQPNSNHENIFKISLKIIFYCVLCSSVFSLIEFSLTNFGGINVTDYVPRYAVKDYDPLVVGFLIRSRGFAEESGHYTFMIEILGPLAIFYLFKTNFCKIKYSYKIVCLLAILLSILTSFSVSSFLIIPFSILLVLSLNFRRSILYLKKKYVSVIAICTALVLLYLVVDARFSITEIIQITITQKFDSFSFDDRKFRADFFQNTFFKLPIENQIIGVGPSGVKLLGYDESYTFLSLYQTISFEIGIIGILLIISLFVIIMAKAYLIKKPISAYFLVAIFSGIIHYNSISNYWYPFLWFVMAFFVFYYYIINVES